MDVGQTVADRDVVGGVDTHKDLHVAAVVDEFDRVLESGCFATTRHGYKQMLTWMRSRSRTESGALTRDVQFDGRSTGQGANNDLIV